MKAKHTVTVGVVKSLTFSLESLCPEAVSYSASKRKRSSRKAA